MSQMYNDGIVQTGHVYSAELAISSLRGDALHYILVPDDRSLREKDMAADIASVTKEMSLFRATTLSSEEKDGLADFDTAWAAYQSAIADVVAQTKAGNAQAGIQSMRSGGAGSNGRKSASAAATKLVEINTKNAVTLNQDGDKTRANTNMLGAGAALVGMLLALFAGIVVSRLITAPLNKTVNMIEELGRGHLSIRLKMNQKDEIGAMAAALDQFAEDLQNVVVGTMKRISNGDLRTDVHPKDDRDEIAPALLGTTLSLRGLVEETRILTKAAVEGKLATRGDTSKFQGEYRLVVQGINDTLDAVIGPLNVSAEYVDRISKGDIPAKITDNYNGDFNEIKNNLNTCIDAVNLLVIHTNLLTQAARDGKLTTRADASRHQGEFRKIVEGINATLDAVVTPINDTNKILAQIAHGDLTVSLNGNFPRRLCYSKNSIESMVGGLKGMAGQSQQSAVNMTSATAQILASSTQMASTTREQASAVNEVTSTVQEIKASAEQVAQRAQSRRRKRFPSRPRRPTRRASRQ